MTYEIFSLNRHLLLHAEGHWAEVSPLAGWNRESQSEALAQLQAVQRGWEGPLLPSVAFGLSSLQNPILEPFHVPAALLFMGTMPEILSQAEQGSGFTHAKVKVGNLSLEDAITLVRLLKDRFRLRVDVNRKWNREQALTFCRAFSPSDIDFLEDPCEEPQQLPFMIASDYAGASIRVWKPTVWGPPPHGNLVFSSAHETDVGIAHIARLAKQTGTPYPIGVGTYRFLLEDILEEPLRLENGLLHVPLLQVKRERLQRC